MVEKIVEFSSTLGPTAVVAVAAFYAIIEIIKLKRNGTNGDGKTILKEIKQLEGNHLHELDGKLEKIDEKQDRMIEILIEIKTLIRNKT
ncbi:hypothetical protein DRN69_04065 [Candidatus Pacearchaeota archaeon]|nr:MAG: hypothetical protein DRN69_04065 [Candidatus Pacearchaeota archaeon]